VKAKAASFFRIEPSPQDTYLPPSIIVAADHNPAKGGDRETVHGTCTPPVRVGIVMTSREPRHSTLHERLSMNMQCLVLGLAASILYSAAAASAADTKLAAVKQPPSAPANTH
jgi:hypothetical protein